MYFYLVFLLFIYCYITSFSIHNPHWHFPVHPAPPPFLCLSLGLCAAQDIEDLDHYEMKEEEPVDGKKSEDDGIEKENLAILEKIRKNQRQDHLNVSAHSVRQPFFYISRGRDRGAKQMFLV